MSVDMDLRLKVVAAARTWLKTPFVMNQCVKGVAVDCGRMPAAALNEAGVKKIDLAALPQIPPNWFLHKASESYLNVIRQFAVEYPQPLARPPLPGDIVVAKYGMDWAHSALVTEWPAIIAATPNFCVAEWRDLHRCPHYAHHELKFFNAFDDSDDSGATA